MELIIKYYNASRFNVYFNDQGNREPLHDMLDRAGLGWLCALCSNYKCLNFGQCIVPNHYNANFRRHTLVQYSNRDRRQYRIQTEEHLREDLCFMFHSGYMTFSNDQKNAVFAGDHSIDYTPPPVESSSDEDETVIDETAGQG